MEKTQLRHPAVSELKQSALANSFRGRLAATASANMNPLKGASSEIVSVLSGEFDAVGMVLAQVNEEFSLKPHRTPNEVALSGPTVLVMQWL